MKIDSLESGSAPVSVVIPCYCCADVLTRAVDSVLSQTLLPQEVILVDDASPDGGKTRECIDVLQQTRERVSGVKIVPVFLHDNVGPGSARNAGWEMASKRYVAFLDSDDVWHRDKLALQFQWMERHPDITLTGHQIEYGDLCSASLIDCDVKSVPISLKTMLFKNRFYTSTVMVRRNIDHRFLHGIRYSEDYHLWTRMISEGCGAVVLDALLAKAHRPPFSDGGASANLWKMERSELLMFRDLVASRRIAPAFGLMSALFSFVKFLRRMLLFRIR